MKILTGKKLEQNKSQIIKNYIMQIIKAFFIIIILFSCFKSASAQLEFYQFMFNIYDNDERITDSRKFTATINIFDREKPGALKFSKSILPGDTSKTLGYDYNFFLSGDLFFERTGEIIVANGTDTMKITLDNPKASAWTSIGIDKLHFQTGTFKFTEENWPEDQRIRMQDNRSFYFIKEDFDWEKIRK
jgi:hypothetical protein